MCLNAPRFTLSLCCGRVRHFLALLKFSELTCSRQSKGKKSNEDYERIKMLDLRVYAAFNPGYMK